MNPRNTDKRADMDLFLDDQEPRDGGGSTFQLHALLRGRYHWAILLGLTLAIIGALGGYFSQGDVYRSTSTIAISPVMQSILGRADDTIARHFDSWVARQIAIMAGPKVLEPAMNSDEWQSAAFGAYKSSPTVFAGGLSVSHQRGQEVIEISYEAPVPLLAQVGTDVVTKAYLAELERSEQSSDSQRLRVLENHRLDLQRRIDKLNADKRALSTEHNELTIGDELKRMTEARDLLETELNETRVELSEYGVNSEGDSPTPDQLTPEQLALHNPQLAALIQTRDQRESDIEFMKRKGMGERHREMREALAALDTLNTQIEKLVQSLRGAPDGAFNSDNKAAGDTTSPIAALKAKEKRLARQYEDAKAQSQHLAMIYGQMQTITADLKYRSEDLTKTDSEIQSLMLESEAPGRAQLISTGGLPIKPYNTGKRKQLAALGGMAGFCGGFGLIILMGLMDRRLRHFEDAQSGFGGLRMLGVLPELPDDLTDPDQAVLASHCVHQVRTLLQIDRGPEGFILAVTGPAAGSGKTSLTMALGMSFASSGSKTLLLDCDIVGGGLTRRLLDKSRSSSKTAGVLEACNGTAFDDCIIKTAIPNLDLLPIGSALPSQAGDLSPAAVRKLLAKARDKYETVLVDTGPVLGSLEAAMVSAQADKTIIIVSRGDQKPIVTKSLNHLRTIGADLAGIVFNHADAVDIERSTYASVTVSQNRRQDDQALNEVKWIDRDTSNRYGPLATAVASYGRKEAHTHHDEE
ncbi:MAG: AAA family ATPase [Phycisphaerales bacterium]